MKLMIGREYRSKMSRKASSSPRRARAVISCALCILAPARALNGLTKLTASIITATSSVRLVSGTRDEKVSATASFYRKWSGTAAGGFTCTTRCRRTFHRPQVGRQKAKGKNQKAKVVEET